MRYRRGFHIIAACLCLGLLTALGCGGPLDGYDSSRLQRQVIDAARMQLPDDAAAEPAAPYRPVTDLTDDQLRELDEISGPAAYRNARIDAGRDLLGRRDFASLDLSKAVRLAVAGNIQAQVARLVPRMSAQQIAQAEAAFDPSLFADLAYADVDRPRQGAIVVGALLVPMVDTKRVTDLNAGIRKRFDTGAAVSASTGVTHTDERTPGLTATPDPASITDITLGITQPLLRNFGPRVNRAEIVLAQNLNARDAFALKSQLTHVVASVEAVYWELVYARFQLAIRQRMLDDTVALHDDLKARKDLDTSPLQIAQAASFVAARRSELIGAQRAMRDASDRLKHLLNADDLPLVGEALIDPVDRPIEQADDTTLAQAVVTALRQRPEMGQARLAMEDAWVRMNLADNQRLPRLDLTAQLSYYGMDEGVFDGYDQITRSDFIDWLIGLQFEQPIGNHAAEAAFRRQRLARQAQALQYRQTAQDVILTVKQAMRAELSAHELIAVNRDVRRAAAENLRAIEQRERSASNLTPEFLLDLKLTAQQRLGEAELLEARVIADYNTARARLLQATGSLLDHHQIDMTISETPPAAED